MQACTRCQCDAAFIQQSSPTKVASRATLQLAGRRSAQRLARPFILEAGPRAAGVGSSPVHHARAPPSGAARDRRQADVWAAPSGGQLGRATAASTLGKGASCNESQADRGARCETSGDSSWPANVRNTRWQTLWAVPWMRTHKDALARWTRRLCSTTLYKHCVCGRHGLHLRFEASIELGNASSLKFPLRSISKEPCKHLFRAAHLLPVRPLPGICKVAHTYDHRSTHAHAAPGPHQDRERQYVT